MQWEAEEVRGRGCGQEILNRGNFPRWGGQGTPANSLGLRLRCPGSDSSPATPPSRHSFLDHAVRRRHLDHAPASPLPAAAQLAGRTSRRGALRTTFWHCRHRPCTAKRQVPSSSRETIENKRTEREREILLSRLRTFPWGSHFQIRAELDAGRYGWNWNWSFFICRVTAKMSGSKLKYGATFVNHRPLRPIHGMQFLKGSVMS